jgi:hypothetical protein
MKPASHPKELRSVVGLCESFIAGADILHTHVSACTRPAGAEARAGNGSHEVNCACATGSSRRRRCQPNRASPETNSPIEVGRGTGITPLG